MITFIVAVVLLLLGYFIYAKFIERMVGVDGKRPTPAVAHPDGVDYVPMKPWKTYLIQFLNIAGVGPICGAIMGAQFGTSCFLWIVFGCIFAGGVHDFLSGYISLRHNGASLPDVHGFFLGDWFKQAMRVFTMLLVVLVVAVFVNTPAVLITNNFTPNWSVFIWVVAIFAYYLIATLLPIDKVIGRIYPLFGFLLLAMAVAIVVAFVVKRPYMPELWEGLSNAHPNAEHTPIFPMMFISIACGAVSGFHATQSPLVARCFTNERQARPVFYGSMITEGIVALIWAAAAIVFYRDPQLSALTVNPETGARLGGNAMVGVIANTWFPPFVATVTILGVIAAAITSGDTALRSARLIMADMFKVDQKPIKNRLKMSVPISLFSIGLLVFSLLSPRGFDVIWRYFAWGNQVLATFTLWAVTVYLARSGKHILVSLIPAMFMTMVTVSFVCVSEGEGFGQIIPHWLGYTIAGAVTLFFTLAFVNSVVTYKKNTSVQQ